MVETPFGQSETALFQLETFLKLFKTQFPDKNVWIYTGEQWENIVIDNILRNVISYVDVIVDRPFEIEKRDITLKFRGSSNQRIINVKETLESNKIVEVDL